MITPKKIKGRLWRGLKRGSPIKRQGMARKWLNHAVSKSAKPRLHRKNRGGAPKSISKLIKECDRLFSIKVRNRMSSNETNMCYTCRNFFPIKKLHAGHYLSRMWKAARWDEDNSRPQCYACNIMRKGDPIQFRNNLIQEIGNERVLAVEAKRNVSVKLTREFLEAKIAELS